MPSPIDLITAVAQRRDRQAFAELFNLFAPKLKSYYRAAGGTDGATAEELVQEVMLAVWQQAASFDPGKASPSTWIFTIARNRRIDHLRRAGRPMPDPADPAFVELDGVPAADGLVEREARAISLQNAIGALPPEQAEMLRQVFFEDKSHRTVARELSLPLGTVKSRIRLALQHLRAAMEPHQ